jgi:hypothetical protein
METIETRRQLSMSKGDLRITEGGSCFEGHRKLRSRVVKSGIDTQELEFQCCDLGRFS